MLWLCYTAVVCGFDFCFNINYHKRYIRNSKTQCICESRGRNHNCREMHAFKTRENQNYNSHGVTSNPRPSLHKFLPFSPCSLCPSAARLPAKGRSFPAMASGDDYPVYRDKLPKISARAFSVCGASKRGTGAECVLEQFQGFSSVWSWCGVFSRCFEGDRCVLYWRDMSLVI